MVMLTKDLLFLIFILFIFRAKDEYAQNRYITKKETRQELSNKVRAK